MPTFPSALIRRISGDHPEWGQDKIAQELAAKFGIHHSMPPPANGQLVALPVLGGLHHDHRLGAWPASTIRAGTCMRRGRRQRFAPRSERPDWLSRTTGLSSPQMSWESFSDRFHGHDERIDVESLPLATDFGMPVAKAVCG